MNTINRMLTNICSDNLEETKTFYTKLFDFDVAFDSDWFIQLVSKDKNFELGIIESSNDLVPEEFQNKPQGFYLTFVVDSADAIFAEAKKEKYEIVAEPADTEYGQRRLLLKDPSGTLVDVSSLMAV